MARKGPPPNRPAARPGARPQPTLGQATGGRPGRVPPGQATNLRQTRAQMAPTPRPPTAPRLGLGLGLGPRQRGAFQQAALGGQGQQYLAANPWLQRRVNQLGPTSPQATRLQNFLVTGQNQRPGAAAAGPAPTPQPPAGPQPWNEQVPPGTTPQIPGGGMPGWTGDNAGLQDQLRAYAGAQAAGQLPGLGQPGGGGDYGMLRGQLGAQMGPGAGGMGYGGGLGGMTGQMGGMYGGFSPQIQNVLQARYGGGLGGMQRQLGGGAPQSNSP